MKFITPYIPDITNYGECDFDNVDDVVWRYGECRLIGNYSKQ